MVRNILTVSEDQSKDISFLTKALSHIGSGFGCVACCSGRPLDFRIKGLELESMEDDPNVEIYSADEDGNIIKEK